MEPGAEPVIYRSPLPAVAVPERTVPEHVLHRARHNDEIALVDAVTDESLTYAEQVEAVARGLVRTGIRPGDTVAITSSNRPLFAVGLHAVMAAGATAALINPMLTPREIVRLSRPANVSRTLDLDDLPWGGNDSPPPGNPRARAVVLFSSGTTGVTKAVGLSHRAIVANPEQHRPGWRIGETDVLAANLPFFHVHGFTIILDSGLLGGAALVTMPRGDAGTYLRRLADHRVTRACLMPPLAAAIADHAGPVPHPRLEHVAPLDDAVRREAERKLGARVRQGYGLTEAGGTHQTSDDDGESDPASIGVLCPGTEARVVEPGTAQAFADGWLRTGDLVRVRDGRFHVVGRVRKMIRYKGYQVAPAELEAVLRRHPPCGTPPSSVRPIGSTVRCRRSSW
ncbi:class I adenylate-forming enzyme family protein [Lentzea sp. CC55]|uniref:class I adenylate-forming enzyme family protein n=1 Tax=Lentzea sp. CC55 TaxID=2884909 RepID=UPI0027E12878|nr:AMP-binding protein [Lentzea sp. CC55]MCG8922748.1 AMP-binding protein [Lentzea sp. CC55]